MAVFASLPEKPRAHCLTVLMSWIQGQPWYRGTGAPSKFTNSHLILPYPGIHSHSLAALTEASKAGAATRVTMLAEACIPLKQDDYKRKYDPLDGGYHSIDQSAIIPP